MEVSSSYVDNHNAKSSFDNYKASFGMLAMLRTPADHVKVPKYDTFAQLKVHFIHAHCK